MRFLYGIFFLYLLPGHLSSFTSGLFQISSHRPLWLPLAIGFAGGLLLWVLLLSRIPGFLTFEHELTHAIVALLFGRKIKEFIVTPNSGGHIIHSGGGIGGSFGSAMITLAPYFIPTFSVLLIIILSVLGQQHQNAALIAMGATLAYHTFSTIGEIKNNWGGNIFNDGDGEYDSDIGKSGQLFSIIVISSAGLAVHGFIWMMLINGVSGYWSWLSGNFSYSQDVFSNLVIWIRHLI